MKQAFTLLGLLIVAGFFQGCREDANSFFSGRPSGMAMAHNRVLDGTLESMIELMRIPQRFAHADESHKLSWQDSLDAWWNAENGRARILAALPHLTKEELRSLEAWVTVRRSSSPKKTAAMLDEVAREIGTQRKDEGRSK